MESDLRVELAAMRRLCEVQTKLASVNDLTSALSEIVAAAAEIAGTDRAAIHLVSEDGEGLELLAHYGYSPDSVFLRQVHKAESKAFFAMPWADSGTLTVAEIALWPAMSASAGREAALAEEVIAFHATPIVSRTETIAGVLSTQFRTVSRPSDAERKVLDMLALAAASYLDRYRNEAALRDANAAKLLQSEAELRVVLKAGRFGAWSLDLATDELTTSEICRTNFGRPPDAPFSYAELRAAVHPLDRARMMAAVQRSLATGEDYDIEYRLVTPAGETRWVQIRARPSYDPAGAPFQISGVSIDVTDRYRAESELRETAERLHLATEHAEIGFWDVDIINDILIWPPRTKKMFGISADVPVSMRDFYAGLHPDDHAKTSAAFAAAADPVRRALYDVEYRTIGKEDGIERWVAAKGRGLFDEDGNCYRVLGTAIDVTARKRDEEQLRLLHEDLEARVLERTAELETAHQQLRQAQKLEAMGSLTGGVAHDFNNLLTPIVGALDMLQRKGVGNEREQRLIAGASQSAERAKVLVQRLLAFARRQPLQAVAVDLAELVRNMAALVASTTGPQVHVEVEVKDTLPPAKGDPNQLEMALLNLSVNARDAMPDGGTLRISARQVPVPPELVPELGSDPYLCLSVSDTGTGMDEETIARAIEPFFSTKGVGKGTGLGLSMVHGLASQLGGKLSIRSEVGIGTTIELWLPETTDRLAPTAFPSNHESFNRSGTALLVDDEEAVRTSTAIMLNDLGYEVIEAQSAEDAVALLGDGIRADIVITDHLMPGMSGVDLARVVRKRRPDLPILLVSGYADTEGVAPDLPRLAKPFARSDLVAALAGIMQETIA